MRRVRLSGTLESGVREGELEESEKEEKASREKWAREEEGETAASPSLPSLPLSPLDSCAFLVGGPGDKSPSVANCS